jgi:hypothetical protein
MLGSRLLPNFRAATLQSGSPPCVGLTRSLCQDLNLALRTPIRRRPKDREPISRSGESVSLQFFQSHKLEGRGVGCRQINGRRNSGLHRFVPSRHAEAPAISCFETRKIVSRSYQVIPARIREFEEFVRHLGADRMQPDITRTGPTVAVAVKTGERTTTAATQILAKYIGRHNAMIAWFPARGTCGSVTNHK